MEVAYIFSYVMFEVKTILFYLQHNFLFNAFELLGCNFYIKMKLTQLL